MFQQFRLNRLARKLKKCKVTTMSNAQLRGQKVLVNGNEMKPLDYINTVAKDFPVIIVGSEKINYVKRMKGIYYRNGLKGLNLYVSYIRLRTIVEMKKANEKK